MSARARIAKRGRTESEGSGAELSGGDSGQRLVGGERSEPGGRAQRGVGEPLRAAGRGPARELVDDARVRSVIGELPGGGRLPDEVTTSCWPAAEPRRRSSAPAGCWPS